MSKATVSEESTEETQLTQKHQEFVDACRAEHGKVICVEVDGELLVFRAPKRAELVNMNKASRKQPELAIEHAIGLCRNCHVGPGPSGMQGGDVDRLANKYTLLFAGADDFKSVSDHLIDLSKGEATISLR
jgi:hypothetical protein